MINFSIIIPHKNSPSDLKRLLATIPDRKDVQVIIVDDNSDNDIVDWSVFIKEVKSNVEIIHTVESHGAGYARNLGIAHAHGKWLMFADADDMFTDHLDEFMNKYMDDNVTDIVYINADNINEDGTRWPFVISYYIANYLKKRILSEKVLRYGIWTPWTRMVKKELVDNNNIKYEEIPTGNDMMFSLNCSKNAATIAVEKNVVYLYFVPQNRSLTEANRRKLSNISYRIELGQRQNRLYKSVGYPFRDTNVAMFRYPPKGIDKKLYQKEYMKELKQHNVCLLSELFHSLINRIGILLGIIKMGSI